jgi:hypothetical protein
MLILKIVCNKSSSRARREIRKRFIFLIPLASLTDHFSNKNQRIVFFSLAILFNGFRMVFIFLRKLNDGGSLFKICTLYEFPSFGCF